MSKKRDTGQWWTRSWSPVTGCREVSRGCDRCWARAQAGRHMAPEWRDLSRSWHDVRTHADRLPLPLTWRAPQVVAGPFMGDLFHADVPANFIEQVMVVVALCARHTFMVPTKRPARMAAFLGRGPREYWRDRLAEVAYPIFGEAGECAVHNAIEGCLGERLNVGWPMRNLWLGASVEDEDSTERRLPDLVLAPAAHRFVSYEPALGPIVDGAVGLRAFLVTGRVDLVIAGPETGAYRRAPRLDWFRAVRDACREFGVGFHLKRVFASSKAVSRELDGVEHNAGPAYQLLHAKQ